MIEPRLAYLASEYPKVSHTFIQREIEGVKAAGLKIDTFSIRKPSASDLLGVAEQEAFSETYYVLEKLRSPFKLVAAHMQLLAKSPGRYLHVLYKSLVRRPGGLKALLYHLIYFAEAGVLARELKNRQSDHLHVHFANAGCTVGMWGAELAGIRFSFTMHGPTEFFDVEKFQLREKIEAADFVSCISDFCRSQLMLFSELGSWNKFHIVHCGVRPNLYSPNTNRAENVLLFVGRMSGIKGVPLILETLPRLKEAVPTLKVKLVGDGPERAALEQQSRDLDVHDIVEFLGFQSQEQVAEHLRNASVLTLPSFAEGLPVVLMEALASEVPVVTTPVAGVLELVDDGVNGLIVAPGNLGQLEEALTTIFSDPSALQLMGKRGRTRVVNDFDAGKEASKLAALFRKCAHKAKT